MGSSFWFGGAGLEQNPKKLTDFFDKILLQLFESGAISYRPDDSVRSESALAAQWKRPAGDRRLQKQARDGLSIKA
jgi:hypothetical protein